MRINVVSSLTPEDESRLAPAMIEAISQMLDLLHVAYAIRVESTLGNTVDRTGYPCAPAEGSWVPLHPPLVKPLVT